MLRIRLFWKIFAAFLAIVVVTALMVAVFASAPAADEYEKEARELLDRQIPLLEADYRDAIETNSMDRLRVRIRGLGLERSFRLTIIDARGEVLADSAEDPAGMKNHGSRPEVLEAKRSGSGRSTRYSTTVEREMMYVASRVDGDDGQLLGFVRVSLPAGEVQLVSSRLRHSILFACLLATLVGLALAWFLARRFTVPVRSLTEAVTSIAAGDYERRVSTDARDELGDLALAFNSMSGELQNRIETISAERSELQAMLSGMVEGVVAVDADGRIVLMNSAAHEMLGMPEALERKSLWEAIPLRPVAEVIARTLQTGRLEQSEIRVAEKTHDRWLQLYVSPIRAAREETGALLVMHDISELRRLERVRRDFVANASHELKTPVAAIHGLVETILEDDEMDDATERAFLERVQRQVARLTNLISEMLALSRLESPEDVRRKERLDLRAAVNGALDSVSPLAHDRGVRVRVDLPGDPVVVRGSGESLQRIVGNLLDNAVKFTPEGGAVDVRIEQADGCVVLEVEDEGPGIAPADRERIFERFYRLDRGRSRDVGGTGLGLAIVKHLVQGLGGEVGVVEGHRAGSLFRVTLPAA